MANSRRKSTATARLRNGAHHRVDQVADSIESMKSAADQYVGRSRQRATDVTRSFEDAVRERPMTAILVGLGVGFLIGCFVARR